MDVEDEPNSYLKYLNDSDTPNTYLLENNEVGLFSVEPIFTEMEATDWPQEGFPLLLANSLITEDSTEDQNTSLDKNTVIEHEKKHLEQKEQHIQEDSKDHNNIEVQNVIEIQSIRNEVQLDEDGLQHNGNYLQLEQKDIDISRNNIHLNTKCIQLNKNCINLEDNPIQLSVTNEGLNETESPLNENDFHLNESVLESNENTQFPKNDTVIQLKSNENYMLVNANNINSGSRLIKLLSNGKLSVGNSKSILKPLNLRIPQEKLLNKKKTKSVNDLFSTVIANKCKICAFLCEDLEQIKRHIGEKHPEFLFTHNGISSGVSLLLSNVKKNNQQSSEVKEEFTVFVCSECHSVCIDKNDLKQHMIQIHRLTTEHAKSTSVEQEVKSEEIRPVYKNTSVLSDVNISLVKKQEKISQKVKCGVTGCIASFPTVELCENHEKLHIGNSRSHFKCKECEETFMMWRIARSHMYKEHRLDFGMIVCPMCNTFKSYKAPRVIRHMVIHTDQKPFECQECGKSFKQLAQLKNHEILHKTPEDLPTWCRVKKCGKCLRFFSNSKSLKSHIQAVHDNFKPFICNICGHKTSRKAMLELHLRQHTGSKPHECEYCEYKTGDPNCLRKHMMKHLGAVTYQCPYCPYKCIQAGSIKCHLLNKHKGKSGTFSCKYCPYTTINSTFLQSHEKNHEISSTEGAITTERERTNETDLQTDEETQSCFLNTESQIEETVDNGGITIPAGLEMQLVS